MRITEPAGWLAAPATSFHGLQNMGDRLQASNTVPLLPGQSLVSPSGRFELAFQKEGNLVVYNNDVAARDKALWDTRACVGKGAKAYLQSQGNFVVYDASHTDKVAGGVCWASDNGGKGGAYIVMQDDGNLVIYTAGGKAVWSSGTQGGHRPSTGIHIPVVSDIVKIVGEIAVAPLKIAENIASGERLDHVAMGALKDQLKIAKDVAPYAEAVVALVPGIGTLPAAMIGAGAALAEGKSIDEATKAAIRGAIPGGAIAQAAFDTAMKMASGESFEKAALETARAQLPPGPAQAAFDIGTAVATGEKIQTALAKGFMDIAPGQLQPIIDAGEKALASTPGLADALKKISPGAAEEGFKIAAGLLSHTGANEKSLATVRAQLPADVRQGFDAALKSQESHTPWLANVTNAPAAPTKPTMVAVKPKTAGKKYGPYPKHVQQSGTAGVGAFFDSGAWRWFAVYANGRPVAQRGPIWLSDDESQREAAGFVEATLGRNYVGTVSRWDWDASSRRWNQAGLGAPPPHGAPHHGGGGGGFRRPGGFRGGRGFPGAWTWWDVPWSSEIVVTTETCRTWSDLIELPPTIVTAAKAALDASKGRPTTVRGPDGVIYLFAFENGAVTARACAAVAAA